MSSGSPGVGPASRRGTDPFAAWWHPPVLLPLAGVRAAADLATSAALGSLRASDLPRAGRVLAEVVSPSRHEPFDGREDGIVRRWDLAALRAVGGPAGPEETDRADATAVPELVIPPQGTRLDALLGSADPEGAATPAGSRTDGAAAPDGDIVPVLADVDGPRPAYVLQWATRPEGDPGIEDVLAVIAAAVDHLGGRVRLTGWSQGGWLAVIHAALAPGSVTALTLIGAPVAFHSRGDNSVRTAAGVSARMVATARENPVLGPAVSAGLPALADLHHAVLERDVWRLLDPVGEGARVLRLLGRIGHDRAFARGLRELTAFTATATMSRRQYGWFLERLVVGDDLARGVLDVGGRTVSPREITCPVRIVAGSRDHVVPVSQALATADLVGTDPADVTIEVVSRDHLGLFTRG